jgi:hypothetical protein
MSMDVRNFSFCPYCGKSLFENKAESDIWLIQGCLYEGNRLYSKRAGYFTRIKNGKAHFVAHEKDIKNKCLGWTFDDDEYRICKTPLDFAPEWATHIRIFPSGIFEYIKVVCGFIQGESIELFWNKCPKQLKGKVLPIPNWARRCENV